MKKVFYTFMMVLCWLLPLSANGQNFDSYFGDYTLRVDYTFCGTAQQQSIYLDELWKTPGWAGRRHRLTELPLRGNGQITMRDVASHEIVYRTSFSALFSEWLSTDEAATTAKSFENVFQLPFPLHPTEVEIVLFNAHQDTMTHLKHIVDPKDILIREAGKTDVLPHTYILKQGQPDKQIDIALLAEGYKADEMQTFLADARMACDALFSYEPFASMKKHFNIVAVQSPSAESGTSVPRNHDWRRTAFASHFDTFYSARYLTSTKVKDIHNALNGIPYEHIIVLVNSEIYGGGGVYNSFTLSTTHNALSPVVIVHEFGHSFGGLADEYYYENDVTADTYPLDIEPWEQNITTRVNFASKWQDMMNVPGVGLYKGGGYSANIYRPAEDCRMRTNVCKQFCPVCQRALRRVIDFYLP